MVEKLAPAVTLLPGTDVTSSFDAAAAPTVIVRRSPPADVMVPSLATMFAVSAL